ncbi:MAG: phosphatidylglycerol lysyltransferase domain-containing protein [Actinomycetota bacterium]|nr:phosphatidylglycerol lysyltransferase domain-containing protein [Actinomycetota bacterium]
MTASQPAPARGPAAFAARPRPWVPGVAALLCFLIGALDLVSALSRANRDRLATLRELVPGALITASAALTLVTGVALLLLARGLRRRKRRAWVLVTGLLTASVLLHVLKGLDVEEAALAGGLLALLVSQRREFRAKGDPRTRWRGAVAFVVLVAFSLAVACALIAVRADDLSGPFQLAPAVGDVLRQMLGLSGSLHWLPDRDGQRAARLVAEACLSFGLLTLLTTSYLVLRPAEPEGLLQPDDEIRMRELLDRFGRQDSLGYFALRRDKSVVWSASGKSCIAYRVVSGVMLASGDPLGDPEAWPGAIAAFQQMAAEHAWSPAVMGCGESGGRAWARAGLEALEIGDEAVVEVADFTLEGRAMRNVRQAVARVERAGYVCDVRRVRDIPAPELSDLRRQSDAWRGAQTERGFSMALGRFGDPADGDCVAVTATKDGALRAFLHFVPWGPDGLSLDLMRRDRTADNGVNELLIVAALRAAPALGVRRVSLNFAVFRSALERGERLGAGPVLRIFRGVLVFMSRWFQIETLYRFNVKFRPIWEPRFVCYRGATELPRVALAALEAEAFLVWPSLRRRRG